MQKKIICIFQEITFNIIQFSITKKKVNKFDDCASLTDFTQNTFFLENLLVSSLAAE